MISLYGVLSLVINGTSSCTAGLNYEFSKSPDVKQMFWTLNESVLNAMLLKDEHGR